MSQRTPIVFTLAAALGLAYSAVAAGEVSTSNSTLAAEGAAAGASAVAGEARSQQASAVSPVAAQHEGALRERVVLAWSADGTLRSLLIRVWDPHPELQRQFTWTPDDPASLTDGDAADGVTGRGRLVWREPGAPAYGSDGVHTTYVGELVAGRPHGFGEQIGADGSRYRGEWRDGRPHGNGVVLFANGDEYRGQHAAGTFHGGGVYASATGNTLKGRFEHGAFVDEAGQHNGSLTSRELQPLVQRQTADGALDVEFALYTDRQKYASTTTQYDGYCLLVYDHQIRPGAVDVSLADKSWVRSWKEGGRIDRSARCPAFDLGVFGLPVFMVADFTNNSPVALSVERAYLQVLSSIEDRQPFLVITAEPHFGQCNIPSDVANRLIVDNHGWGSVESAVTELRFVRPGQPVSASSQKSFVDLNGFKDFQTVSFQPLLRDHGVQTERLTANGVDCPSMDAVPNCIAQLAETGIFGGLSDEVSSFFNLAITEVAGTLTYQWRDVLGELQQMKSPYRIQIPLYGFTVPSMPECGAYSPPIDEMRKVELDLNNENYRIVLNVPEAMRVIMPRQNRRLRLNIDAQKSSAHRLRGVVELTDGRRIYSPIINLNIFKFRENKAYVWGAE